MYVLTVRNVQEALPRGLDLLFRHGVQRESRNGPVLQFPEPVCTVYTHPWERVLFWPQRDANPFFHLYESLWMLAGRNDLEGVLPFAKQMAEYSDDGKTFHGAYGNRWRNHFLDSDKLEIGWETSFGPFDQLPKIVEALKANKDDRRCVLQMWDPETDLGRSGKDFPCNVTATFQVAPKSGLLEMTVFNRSNDIVWGAYGANAVHFSMLHEYMCVLTGLPMGYYRQISTNYHGYLSTLDPLRELHRDVFDRGWHSETVTIDNPYRVSVRKPMLHYVSMNAKSQDDLDAQVATLLNMYDTGSFPTSERVSFYLQSNEWLWSVLLMLKAHKLFKTLAAPERFDDPMRMLADSDIDWHVAGYQWLDRRRAAWEKKVTS